MEIVLQKVEQELAKRELVDGFSSSFIVCLPEKCTYLILFGSCLSDTFRSLRRRAQESILHVLYANDRGGCPRGEYIGDIPRGELICRVIFELI